MKECGFSCQTGMRSGTRERSGAGLVNPIKYVTVGKKTVYAPAANMNLNPASYKIAQLGIEGAIDSASQLTSERRNAPHPPKKKFLGIF